MFLKAVTILAAASCVIASPLDNPKDPKSISLFAVVSFPNDECTSTDKEVTKGICMSSTECSDKGGKTDKGNCGSGFGVCCIFKVDCNDDVKNNCTYVENDAYPTAVTVSTTSVSCTSKIKPEKSGDICQLRFDFDNVDLPVTATTGACVGMITITSPTGFNPPVLCGKMTGDHLYVETGTSSTDVSLKVETGTTAGSYKWRIKVSQIECDSMSKPPTDCSQYFTGPSGTFQSFNFAGQLLTQSQEISICFRQEMGYCSIAYAQDTGITSTEDAFQLNFSTSSDAITMVAGDCAISRINVPFGAGDGHVCGGLLGTIQDDTVAGNIVVDSLPFRLNFVALGTSVLTSNGYRLVYSQIPC